MQRRTFLSAGLSLGLINILPGGPVAVAAASRPSFPSPEIYDLLADAARTPSSHNSQPWSVQLLLPQRWRLSLAPARLLPAVDPAQRESWISIGAFLAALEIAAQARGLAFESAWAEQAQDQLELVFRSAPTEARWQQSLRQRRTLRRELGRAEVDASLLLRDTLSPNAVYLPQGSAGANAIAGATVRAALQQNAADAIWEELADWIHWSDSAYPTGITPETMELPWLVRGWVAATYGRADVLAESFRLRSLEITRQQVQEGAGWIVISSAGDSRDDCLECGRSLLRIWLAANRAGLAVHPMSQALEVPAIRESLGRSLEVQTLQMLLRIGKPAAMRSPVSLRLPPERFAFNPIA